MLSADAPLRFVRGVGPRRADKLAEAGLTTVEDLLYVFPFRYEDRRRFGRIAELQPGGREVTLHVEVLQSRVIPTRRRGFKLFEAKLADDSGEILALWYNQPFLQRVLVAGRRAVVFGRASKTRFRREPVLENPDYEVLEPGEEEGIHTGRIVPVYRKLGDLSSRMQRVLQRRILADLVRNGLDEVVPERIAGELGLLPRLAALQAAHFPGDDADLDALAARATPAQRSLAFEEMFVLQLALAHRRQGLLDERRGIAYELTDALRTKLGRMLPFRLTGAQQRVLREIGDDLRSPHPMNRLVQGDVGSGKTVVALLTMLVAVENGYQAALMAPTEILAEQHYRSVHRLLEREEVFSRSVLLTGSLKAAARRRALASIASGQAQLVVGTHALFESGVEFRRLGLAVIDEQHRFGVLQRAALADKGERPDVLVMTATPIPRSLALTVYGDLDVSVIDELPPGRTPIRTVVRTDAQREQVFAGVRQAVEQGRQAFVVVPLVEETAKSDLKAATAHHEELSKRIFPRFEIGLLHGRMKGEEKDAVMQAFAAGKIDVLVATTVVEVGVDVPNATVMVVEHAERFGLSQLHQLRGRVGRGSQRSYCVLMAGPSAGPDARERLAVMEQTSDGFVIAEKDLELRGPGAVFGTQQHGLSDLQFLSVVLCAPELLEAARREAQRMCADRGSRPVLELLRGLRPGWRRRLRLAEVG